ncbi:MAG TPA: Ldh family oxidoreductase [Burkholderiales bacterium]|jgi:LDH2 family malate/lactate/ureidoglycolate dehydrogenase|nr:Ldh family oxidoreductase [Burkholderiales bacterium]
MNVAADRVREQITSILTAWGMNAELVQTTVEAMLETDLAGVDSHGISMLMDYEQSSIKGKLNLAARPRIVRQNPVTALIDADAGLGHPAAVMGMNLAIEKALAMGVGVVSVFNSHHFGAAGYYAQLAPKRGLIGLVTSASRTINTVPTRATVPVLGTNPIAFAAPANRNRRFLLDMATATVAANKVKVYDLNNKPLPAGWVLDDSGQPVTDASKAMMVLKQRGKDQGGGLAPLGGTAEMSSHKGYGLSMLAHILGGTLSGASFSPIRVKTQQPKDPDNLGHFFMALDPKAFRDEGAFESDLDDAIDVLHGTPAVDPGEPVLVHGDPEAASREQRLRDGIPIPQKLADQIRAICERCGAPYVLGS